MKKAIFFDIDGTLLDCQNGITDITPRVKKAIRSLQNEGNYVFIASGRPYAFISKELLDFGFNGFIFTNGTQVIVENELIYKKSFDKALVKGLISDLMKFNIQYVLQGEVYSYIKEEYKELYSYYDSFSISREYIKSEYDIDNIDIYKMDMLCRNKAAVDYCLSLDNEEYNYNHNLSSNVFEFYFKNDTKASGILKALKHLNIPIENSHAKQVTDTVQNDGVALRIKRFILNI